MYAHLLEFLCNFSLSQIVKCPTRFSGTGHSSTIDLVLVTRSNNVENCTYFHANSDHLGLFLTLNNQGHYEKKNFYAGVYSADFSRVQWNLWT